MRRDLNDFAYFVKVVEHGSLTAASQAAGIPKATLSRRLQHLEDQLGIRLMERSARRLHLTELGQAFYQRCKVMVQEADAAESVVEAARAEPTGTIRLACPVALLHTLMTPLLIAFGRLYPGIALQIFDVNRAVDVVAEGFDLALRARPLPLEDSPLVMRTLGYASQVLVASPELVNSQTALRHPDELSHWPMLACSHRLDGQVWALQHAGGEEVQCRVQARFATTDMLSLRMAAEAGLGVVQLPEVMVRESLHAGKLVRVLPDWSAPEDVIHAVFASRQGLRSNVRLLITYLTEALSDSGGN